MRVVWALLGVLLMAACSGASESGNRSGSVVPVPSGLESECPPKDTPLRFAEGDLPDGAVGARLCPGPLTIAYTGAEIGTTIQGPLDELTTNVDSLIELANSLPEFQGGACPFDLGPTLVYWFRYPDGDARAVSYAEGGCHTLVIGENQGRKDGAQLATAFADALLAQRSGSASAAATSRRTVTCPTPPVSTPISALPQIPLGMTRATWCQGVAPYQNRAASIPARLLQRVNQSLVGDATEERYRCKSLAYGQWIEGINAWGDRVSYFMTGCHVIARTGYGRDHITTTFEADPDLTEALRSLPLGPVRRWDPE